MRRPGPAERLEAFLARLYTDLGAREAFLADSVGEARRAGLAADDVDALAAVDRTGLELAADRIAHKRHHRRRD